jgi:polysaccharide export outer membrane protein
MSSASRLTALCLVGSQSLTSIVPFALLAWRIETARADSMTQTPSQTLAQTPGQTPMPPTLEPGQPIVPPQHPTSLDLVEQARQRLRDRGELPNAVPTPAPSHISPSKPTPTVAPSIAPKATPSVRPTIPTMIPPGLPGVAPTIVAPPVTPPVAAPPSDESFEPYRLGGGDTISVVVQRFPDLNFQATLDQEGNITAPLLGRFSLKGLTIEQAQEKVRQGLDRYVINPIVYLALASPRPVLVTLTGEVSRPGLYPLQLPRVSSALLTAGGATATADLRAIRIKRSLSDGSTLEEKLDLVTPLKDGSPLPDLRLQDGDVVVIPKIEVGTSQDYDRDLVARSTLVKPQITVRILSYASGGLGNVTLPNGSTFLDALSAARPNPDRIDFRKVAVVRFDPLKKKAVTREIDARKVLMGDLSNNIALEDNDVIVIGRNLVGKITYALNTVTQPFRDILGFLLFFKELRNGASSLFGPTSGSND